MSISSNTNIDNQDDIIEVDALFARVLENSSIPQDLKEKCLNMLNRIRKIAKFGYFSKEFEPIEKYVNWILSLPWGVYTNDNLDLNLVQQQLDKTHFGLQSVKERILEYVAVLNLKQKKDSNNSGGSAIICFVGVQGIGKTSIAKSIATALGRSFVRIPLGGLSNITEIRGLSKSEINSEPGQIIKSFVRTKTMNPLILLDEIDKVSKENSVQADIMAALLEILDPEQNSTFKDHYLDYPVDLSKCIFICTANNLGGISAALLDRLEIIRMVSYTDEEKISIAKNYLLPKVINESGLDPSAIIFNEDVWPLVVRPLGFDAGIRQLERTLRIFIRKIAKRIVLNQGEKFEITKENFKEYIPMDIGVLS